jgi:hypothetical protein
VVGQLEMDRRERLQTTEVGANASIIHMQGFTTSRRSTTVETHRCI